MKYFKVKIKDDDYELLKKYTKNYRKYVCGSGYKTIDLIQEIMDSGIDAVKNSEIIDDNGNPVKWKF